VVGALDTGCDENRHRVLKFWDEDMRVLRSEKLTSLVIDACIQV